MNSYYRHILCRRSYVLIENYYDKFLNFYDTFISMMSPLPLIIVSTQAILVQATVQGHSGLWRISDCWGRYGCNRRENYIIGYTSEQ